MIGDWRVFLLIQPYQYHRYAGLLEQSFRLRNRDFTIVLAGRSMCITDLERDAYDGLGAVYLVWCDKDARHLYGTVRLMPTTGPTLLHDVFRRTLPEKDLVSPVAWEGTRMCLDVDLLKSLNRRSAHQERLGSFAGLVRMLLRAWHQNTCVELRAANGKSIPASGIDRGGDWPC